MREMILPAGATIPPVCETIFPVGKMISPICRMILPVGGMISRMGKVIARVRAMTLPVRKMTPLDGKTVHPILRIAEAFRKSHGFAIRAQAGGYILASDRPWAFPMARPGNRPVVP